MKINITSKDETIKLDLPDTEIFKLLEISHQNTFEFSTNIWNTIYDEGLKCIKHPKSYSAHIAVKIYKQ